MQCKYCGTEIHEKPGGHRARQYCSDRCKTAYFRRQKAQASISEPDAAQGDQGQDDGAWTWATERIANLEGDLEEAQGRIRALERQLDIEQRFLYGTEALNFKAWLKKHAHMGLPEVGKKLLDEEWLEPRGSRGRYEAFLRKAEYSADDIAAFRDLWRLMLLEQS